MTTVVRAFGARLCALVLCAVFALAATGGAAQAQGFVDEVGGKTTVKLNDIPSIKSMLSSVGLSNSLGNIDLAGVSATSDTISGFVNFIAMRWNFLFFKAGTSSYFALEPVTESGAPRTPKLSDFINVPGIQLTDMLTFDRVAMAVAVRTVTLNESDLPAPAKAMFSPYFQNKLANVELAQGVTYFGMADLGKLQPLKQAFEAIGGQSTQILFKAQLTAGLLDALTKNEKPNITARFEALLPTIQPQIKAGNATLKFPGNFTFGLVAELTPPDVKFGFIGAANVPFAYPNIAKKRIDTAQTELALQVGMGLEGGKPTFSISGTMFKGEAGAFKQAFGLPFLDLQDYTMEFETSPDAISVGIGTGGRFYDKKIETFASVQIPAETSGIPAPKEIKFMVTPTNPNQIASLSLTDLTNAFSDLTSAVTGSSIPKVPLPENFVQIKGTKVGEGPFIDLNLNIGLDAGLEMAGGLTVFGSEIGVVDQAIIKPTEGINIQAHTSSNFPIDIIQLPTANIDIAITKDNITDPHVRIRTQTVQILGTGGSFELSIDKSRQVAIIEGASPWNLFQASLVLDSSTQNLKAPNFDVTGIIEGNFFNKLADGLQAATADLVKGTESVVSGMNTEVHTFSQQLQQAYIDKSKAVNDLEAARRSANAAFEKAKRDVDSLQKDYDSENSDCDALPWHWHHCVAAGTLWVSLKTAKGVLSLAQKGVDEFLKGTGAALSAVVDGLNKTINGLGTAIDKATGALGTALVSFSKVLDLGAKLAGKALEAVANVFDIEKLWMKGKLAILQGQQQGQLGVQFTMLGKEYLQDVSWDFKVPVDQIVEIFKPGSKPSNGGKVTPVTVAPGYTFEPASTDVARNVASYLMNNAVLRAVSVPFDPQMCVKDPYILDQQLAEIRAEADRLNRMARNADVYKWVQAIEGSRTFMSGGGSSANLSWKAGAGGSVPSGAIAGGSEPGRTLWVCRANYNGGTHPGKIVAQNCNIGYGGREITLRNYEVLTGNSSALRWVGASNGAIPAGAVAGGSEPGRTLYVCRARYNNGVHPGKVVARNCNIGWGGAERLINSYEVLVASSGPTELPNASNPFQAIKDVMARITTQNAYATLMTAYKAGKTSNAQADSTQRFSDQGNLLTAIGNAIRAIPANDGGRREIEANYQRPLNVNGALDVKFLTDRYNEAKTQIAKMEALQKDPASPCGKAIQQANVTPTKPSGPAPRGLSNAFATSAFANAAVQAAKKLQAAQTAAAKQHADTLRKAQLVAFANMLKQREAAAKAAAAQAAKLNEASQKIVPVALAAKAADAQAIAAAAQRAATKVAAVAQKPQIRAIAPPPKPAAAGQPAARALPPRQQAARGRAPVVIPGATLTPQARQAFAAAFTRDAQQMTQAAVAAEKRRHEQLAQLRATLIAKRQADVARRIAAIPGLSDQQKAEFAKAFAEARTAARAQLIKQIPVSRLSSVPGTPFATKEANAQKVTPSKEQDVVEVNANILQAMKRLTAK